jgi:hypothetical protein
MSTVHPLATGVIYTPAKRPMIVPWAIIEQQKKLEKSL